jgi:acyl-CoA reductase-like NAD-dependent aldehyde dehydrogenase
MDRAILLIQQAADKSPTISEVVAKMEERFKSIETQFTERDVRTDQTARDSKVGIDAALSAAKEAVSKAQDATTKQIDSILAALAAASKAADDKITSVMAILEQTKQGIDSKIDDVKGRVGSIESRGKGIQDIGLYLAIGVAIVILGLTFLLKH